MIHQASQGLASLGRNGDSMLVHMSPNEVAGLQGLAMAQGGSLTINPDTGMPEAFNLGGFFSSFLPTIAGMAFAPATGGFSMAPILAGAATGAGLAAVKGDDPLMGGLMGGLGGYGGGQMGPAFKAAGASNLGNTAVGSIPGNAATTVGNVGGTNEIGSSLLKSGVTPSAETTLSTQISPFTNNNLGTSLGVAPGAQTSTIAPGGYDAAAESFGSQIGQTGRGIKNVLGLGDDVKQADAWKAFTDAGGSGTTLALTGAGALLGGLESPDPFKPEEDRYDPYATLNLSGDTGLRLYAGGGDVYANQSSISSGGLQSLYGTSDNSGGRQPLSKDGYGIGRLETLTSAGSQAKAADMFYAQGGYLNGDGDGMSDSIPATIEGKQPARLADGEFVIPADVVSHIGNGSSKAGSKRLYKMLDKVRHARTGTKKQGREINPNKYLPA